MIALQTPACLLVRKGVFMVHLDESQPYKVDRDRLEEKTRLTPRAPRN